MSYEVDDNIYPATAVVYIRSRWGGEWFSGSGVIVGKNDVLTAAHVIYDKKKGGIANEILIYPSYDPDETPQKPYTFSYVEYFPDFDPNDDNLISSGDFNSNSYEGAEKDIALLTTHEKIGEIFGWLGIDWGFKGGQAGIMGFPGLYKNQPMYDSGFVAKHAVDNILDISKLEVNPGNSGGPVFYQTTSGAYVAGLVSTSSAAVSVASHQSWLQTAMAENDGLRGVKATIGNDILIGTDQSETIEGSAGNDVITGGRGNDAIDGGPGIDTAIFNCARSSYSVTRSANGSVTVSGSFEGVDTLSNVERIRFTDSTVSIDIDGHGGQAYRLYQAAFNRQPDSSGLGYWIDVLDRGIPLVAVAQGFIESNEFKSIYGNRPTNAQIVERLYDNVLHRQPDPSGYDYWLNRLNSKSNTIAEVLFQFSESPENQAALVGTIGNGFSFTPFGS
jgi:V8-like Glu-specific endopeptidase